MSRTYRSEDRFKIQRELDLDEERNFESFLQEVTFIEKKSQPVFHKEVKYRRG